MNNKYYWGAFVLDSVDLFIKNDFNKSDYLIYLLLCRELDPETNIVNLNQKNIIKILDEKYDHQITKGTVSKSINKLLDGQFISKSINRQGFMVNPNLFYLGPTYSLQTKNYDFINNLKNVGETARFYLDTEAKKLVDYQEDSFKDYEI